MPSRVLDEDWPQNFPGPNSLPAMLNCRPWRPSRTDLQLRRCVQPGVRLCPGEIPASALLNDKL
jgi:hypothetical protein